MFHTSGCAQISSGSRSYDDLKAARAASSAASAVTLVAAAANAAAEAAELAALAAFKTSYDLDPDDIWTHPEVWNMQQSALHACKMARESAAKARYAAERAALYAS